MMMIKGLLIKFIDMFFYFIFIEKHEKQFLF